MKRAFRTTLWTLAIGIVATLTTTSVTAQNNQNTQKTTPQSTTVKHYHLNKKAIEVFTTPSEQAIPYRIPAIAQNRRGELIAAADYRYSRSDIGLVKDGRIDLKVRISNNNGATWSKELTIAEGKGAASPDFMNVGFGDPCIVADRESDEVLVVSCAGNVAYTRGQRNLHQNMVCIRSNDGGHTWSKPHDMAESIYSMFDHTSYGPVRAMFMASGRIMQSQQVKVGDYYRIYAALLITIKSGVWINAVIYSDDFGRNWKLLGDKEDMAIPQKADEAKVEEMPDGSIVISSRIWGGRQFNRYTFDDIESAKGHWGKMALSGDKNEGVVCEKEACNGELMLLPVRSKVDRSRHYLLLQSVPLGPYRRDVGIYYKVLSSPADYSSPDIIARNWEGFLQVTNLGSAYSTMTQQSDGSIGFLYEEETHCSTRGGGYSIIYKNISVEDITAGKYTFDKKPKRKAFLKGLAASR